MLTNALSVKKIAAIDAPGLHGDGAGLYLKVTKTGAKGAVSPTRTALHMMHLWL